MCFTVRCAPCPAPFPPPPSRFWFGLEHDTKQQQQQQISPHRPRRRSAIEAPRQAPNVRVPHTQEEGFTAQTCNFIESGRLSNKQHSTHPRRYSHGIRKCITRTRFARFLHRPHSVASTTSSSLLELVLVTRFTLTCHVSLLMLEVTVQFRHFR